MHNNFAIFDCKLLTTGSYYWNEHVESLVGITPFLQMKQSC